MIEVKQNFVGGLDLDTSLYQMRKEAYLDALNITRDSTSASNDLSITNIIGNRKVSYNYPPGIGKVIGACANTLRGTLIFMRHSTANYHGIYEFNESTRVITKIFENLTDTGGSDILDFTADGKINNINIINREDGDLLFFLDSSGKPLCLNITRFKNGEYTPVTLPILEVAKLWPSTPPSAIYTNDTSRRVNNTRNKLFRFKYRWVYDDDEKSTWGPISAVPLPVNILQDTYTSVITNNNLINVSLNSGGKNVKGIEFAMSFVNKTNNWSDFALVDYILKDNGVTEIPDNYDFIYQFYNDGTYPIIDVEESILPYDFIPLAANAQEMPNGNVVAYAGLTEGYNRDLVANVTLTINTVAVGTTGTTGSLNAVPLQIIGGPPSEMYRITFSGIPATGTTVNVNLVTTPGGVTTNVGTYTTVAGDTASSIAAALETSMDNIGITFFNDSSGAVLEFWFDSSDYNFQAVVIVTPTVPSASNSQATWPWSTERRIGLVYFDAAGRTNGILYSGKISFPAYAENGSQQCLVPYINAKIYHTPPIWADSFQWAMTKEPTQWLFWHVVDVNTTEPQYIYFDITNMSLNSEKNPTVGNVLSWTFQDGDRMRLIRQMNNNTVFADTYDAAIEGIVFEPTINSVVQTGKTFVKIKSVSPLSTVTYTSDFFVIQLYRPGQQSASEDNQVYYEFGQRYPILNAGTESRAHGGEVTDQSGATPAEFNFYEGDSYFRPRTVYLSQSGFGTFNVQDRNFVDFYISAVSSIDGRPTAIDVNAKQSYYPTLIRFGQEYQQNTSINGLNRFYPNNFDEYDYSFGDVMRLKVRDRFMRVYQKNKIGAVPLFSQITKNANGEEISVVTDKLLNPIQYYSGDYGIGTNASNLVSFNFSDYVADNIRGALLRVDLDGITTISVIYKVNSWATSNLPLRTGTSNIYGAYDQKLNKYIVSVESATGSEAQTLAFDEAQKSFDGFLSYKPEMMSTLGTLLITFKEGDLWTHDSTTYNNFYGVQYDSYIDLVFNENPLGKKTWVGLTQISSAVWDCPVIYTNVNSYGSQRQETNLLSSDFKIFEGVPAASFLRDSFSIGGINNGDSMKGNYCVVRMRKQSPTSLVSLSMVSVKHNISNLTAV